MAAFAEKQQPPPPPEPYNGWRPDPEKYRGEHADDYMQSVGHPRVWQQEWEAGLSEPPVSAGGLNVVTVNGQENGDVAAQETTPASTTPGQPPTANGQHPQAAFLATLRKTQNAYGRDIWIEKDGHLGKPDIWYEFDSKGVLLRCVRHSGTVTRTRVEKLEDQ